MFFGFLDQLKLSSFNWISFVFAGNSIDWQLVPIPELVKELPDRDSPSMNHELVFLAADLPPLGSKSFYVRSISGERDHFNENDRTSSSSKDYIISNKVTQSNSS